MFKIPKNNDKLENARARERGSVAIAVEIRTAGGIRTKARILDLSETGFRMDCMTDLPGDRSLFLTIPTFAQLEARIAWRTEWTYGCRFEKPLHTAIYEHILGAHPAFARPL